MHVQSMLDSLGSFGGIYLAMLLFAMLSGVFPLTNSEAALVALGAASGYRWPELVVLAVITGVGQSVTHALLFHAARGLAKVGAKKRPWLEAKIAKAHAVGARWQKSELTMIALGATVGIPPQALVALLAGVIGIRFRTFALIDVTGRIARFTTIVLVAHLF